MYRPISTRTHAALDSLWTALAGGISQRLAEEPAAARLVRKAATVAGLNAMLTNYEAGAIRLVPMRGHLGIDLAIGTALLLSPLLVPRAERRALALPIALGAAGVVASLLTQTQSPAALRRAFRPSRELSEAVGDADVTGTEPRRAYLE